MTVRLYMYVHSSTKRAETITLLDSGATENFLNLQYARNQGLPIHRLLKPRNLFNIDGTPNKQGTLKYYTNLSVQMGSRRVKMRFFLSDLGENKVILGYPWFMAFQPNIDWAWGWIDHLQLPIIARTPDTRNAKFLPRHHQHTHHQDPLIIAHVTIPVAEHRQTLAFKLAEQEWKKSEAIPMEYQSHAHMFSEQESQHFPQLRIWDHAIKLQPGAPATLPAKVYQLNPLEREELLKFVQAHLEKGYIWPSKSPYAAPFFFIKKKDGKLQPVQDYWRLNKWTIWNRYPLPLIPQLINRVWQAQLFTKFNIRWGYNNVRIKSGDKWKVAFLTNEGLFEPTVMFFGLTNSPATFQMMMNTIFEQEICEGWLTIYMDDMLITSDDNLPLHWKRVHHILWKLWENDLYLKPEKCIFEATRVEFLGVILEHGTIQMDPTKTKGVETWPTPTTPTNVRAFLGFTGFYWYFIQNYSAIARPLLLTKKNMEWHWGMEQEQAFQELKKRMCSRPVLKQPNYKQPFFLQTDTSAYGMGAILSQEGENSSNPQKPKLHPIAYYSSTFSPTERNYDIYERELLQCKSALSDVSAAWDLYGLLLPQISAVSH